MPTWRSTCCAAHTELRKTDDPILGWKWVTVGLDAGRAVMVWADIAELPYLRVRLRVSRHDIVVICCDGETRNGVCRR